MWKLMENPADATQSIWISDDGQVRWSAPNGQEILTLEERQLPQGKDSDDVKDLIEGAVTSNERDWRIFRHGVPTDDARKLVLEDLIERGEHCEAESEGDGSIPTACADIGSVAQCLDPRTFSEPSVCFTALP